MIAVSIVDNRNDWEIIWDNHAEYLPQHAIYLGPDCFSIAEYNKLLTTIEFWVQFEEDKVLIIQHDSGLLRDGIEEFLQYDFIGAPIKHIEFPCMNGGLSLRSTEAMIRCIKDTPYNSAIHGNEDIYFCNQLKKLGGNLPTKEVAQSFSVETIYGLGSLGYHAMDKYLTKKECETILNQYTNEPCRNYTKPNK